MADGELTTSDAIVKCFLKNETSTTMTDPRNISPRSDRFLAVLGPRISAIEHYLHEAEYLVKGLDLEHRDLRMSPLIDFDTYAETDYSRFDMTISSQWLELVQDPILQSAFPDDDWIGMALKLARKTKGVSESGMCYDILGTRCSGDAHTSIGNGLINRFNTWLLFQDVPKDGFRSWHEGDDGILGLTAPYAHLASRVYTMDCLGFAVKAFITRDINTTSFCGRFLSSDGDQLLSYCDPYRSLAKLHITLSQGKLQTLLLAKTLSYAYTDGQTPIIGPIVQSLAELLRHRGANLKKAQRIAMRERWLLTQVSGRVDLTLTRKPVDERLRVPFSIRTGIPPEEQERIERYYTDAFRDFVPAKYDSILPLEDVLVVGEDRLVHYMPSMHY